ncbi:helix-turn-helix transcriptional regulator [Duganella sp. CT11-25]|uniref:LexA family transcriptional regulator n=1 Tax=unclassified Duganella TaxID=2636909 RepID=UPI0039AFCA1B
MKIKYALSHLLAAKPGASMSDVARACDVTPQAVQQWFTGVTTPRGLRLKKVANYFGMTELEFAVFMAKGEEIESLDFTRLAKEQLKTSADHPVDDSDNVAAHDQDFRVEAWEIGSSTPFRALELPIAEAQALVGPRELEYIHFGFAPDDAMDPTFALGDLLFLDRRLANYRDLPEDGIYVFTLHADDKMRVRRLQKVGDQIAVKSDNPLYETWYVNEVDRIKGFYIRAKVIRVLPMKMKILG